MKWREKQNVGFSVKSPEELQRVLAVGVNLVELKVEKFNKSELPLYAYKDGRFEFIRDNARKLMELINEQAKVNLHLPVEGAIDASKETGLNPAVIEHHDILLGRFVMLEELHRLYGIGGVVTMHPPTVSVEGLQLIEEKTALDNAKIFFDKLDALRLKDWHIVKIGVENMTDIKTKAGTLGYLPGHFKTMLRDTRTIGLTLDTGHRRLAKEFRVRDFLSLGMDVVNIHFHGNAGEFNPENYDDDQHRFPEEGNVKGYRNFVRYFRRHRPPIILEISHLERYSNEEIVRYLNRFYEEIA